MADDNRPFDGMNPGDRADRMHRHADRLGDQLRRRCGGQGGPPVFFGLLFLMMGAMFLLDNLGIVEARHLWRTFWPLVAIVWGTSRLISGFGDRFFPMLAIGGGTLLLANRALGWDLNVARLFGPVILIAFGAHILYRSWRRPAVVHASGGAAGPASFTGEPGASPDAAEESSSTFRDSAMLGSVERRNVSQTFRGGDASAFMGSVEIDLRDSRMAAAEAVVDVSVVMGSVELRIPRDWAVESSVSALLGSFEDHTAAPVDGSAKRLVVRGSVLLGSVEIRN